jgi:hypothetical protein
MLALAVPSSTPSPRAAHKGGASLVRRCVDQRSAPLFSGAARTSRPALRDVCGGDRG